MNVAPLKFRTMADGILFCDDAGGFFKSDAAYLERYVMNTLTSSDYGFLVSNGHAFGDSEDVARHAFRYRWARRFHIPAEMQYVILVPTLRCNLSCAYCQVSRVNEHTPGHDWSNETVAAVITWMDGLPTKEIKIEFQGGEPLLRLDLLKKIRDFARSKFERASFVVCTNLQDVTEEAWSFLASVDTHVSTSLDPTLDLHQRHRTGTTTSTEHFLRNLRHAVDNFPERVSALPTFDVETLPDPRAVIETYASFGLSSIYLRAVNHQASPESASVRATPT